MNGSDLLHKACAWCKVLMGIKESEDYHLENGNKVYCCYYCRQFASKEDVEQFKTRIIILAINPMYSQYLGYPWI